MSEQTFAIRLKKILVEKKMKQVELAETLHVSTVTVSRWINGVQVPENTTIKHIAKELNVREEYLKCEDDNEMKIDGRTPLKLYTTEELLNELKRRMEASEK